MTTGPPPSAPVFRPLPTGPVTEVYLFGTCLVDLFTPSAGVSTVRLLQREGVRVIFPQGQSCCGQPAYNSGHPEEARTVARAQIPLFCKDIPIVIPSGSCGGMIRQHWPHLFAGQPEEAAARAIAARVWELSEFLVHVLKVSLEDHGTPETVTWHSSCHAMREMGLTDEPKRLLGQLKNVTVAPLQRERECCGFGGTFAVRHADVSAAMVADKCADIEGTGAATVLGGDCGCLMNISGALEHKGSAVGSQHLADYLWERTK
ncbi:(Fe-S)-binding protein [Novispirillum itersonii]|uniref:(Fe-S)-binding protein n=1 Tax=Novispirillum itersonii TaxID=189 RepID=UPI0003625D1A|nr:(Fe-S)-binding protein [Novispirillum itersonii]